MYRTKTTRRRRVYLCRNGTPRVAEAMRCFFLFGASRPADKKINTNKDQRKKKRKRRRTTERKKHERTLNLSWLHVLKLFLWEVMMCQVELRVCFTIRLSPNDIFLPKKEWIVLRKRKKKKQHMKE